MKTILKIFILILFLYSLKLNSKDLKLYGSGENKFGQLGLSSTMTRHNFELINEGDWIKIFSDGNSTFGIKKDSTLWAWGLNHLGQLGNGEADGHGNGKVKFEPELILNDYFISISSYFGSTIGVKGDSTLWSWGSNYRGELGTGDLENYYRPVQIDSNKWIKVFAGGYANFALKSDSTLWGWGSNGNGMANNGKTSEPVLKPEKVNDFKWIEVSAGGHHIIGIRDDGTLWGWGYGINGELGTSTNTEKEPILISNQKWLKVSAVGSSSFAIKSDGTLWATGGYITHFLKDKNENRLNQISSEVWVEVYGNPYRGVFGIHSNGSIWVAGHNIIGQLGIGENGIYNELTQFEIDGELKQLVTSVHNTFLLIDDSKNYSNEKVIYDFTNVISSNDTITYNYYSDTLHFTYNTNSELILSDKISEFEIEIFYDKYHFFPTIDAFEFSIQNDSINSKIEKIDGKINKLTIKNLGSSTFTFNDLPIIKGMLLANSDSISYLKTNIYYKNVSVSSVKINNLNHKIVSKGKTWVTDHLLSDLKLKILNSVLVDNQLNIVYQTKNVNDALKINIYNNYGLSVEEIVFNEIDSEETIKVIDISGLSSGMYIFLLSQNGQVKSRSFLKVN